MFSSESYADSQMGVQVTAGRCKVGSLQRFYAAFSLLTVC